MQSTKSITDELKKKVDELDLDTKLAEFTTMAEKTMNELLDKAGTLAHDKQSKVSELLDKAGAAIDKQTDGKYADQVVKVKDAVVKGVAKLAERGDSTPSAEASGDVWAQATDEPVGGEDAVAGPVDKTD